MRLNTAIVGHDIVGLKSIHLITSVEKGNNFRFFHSGNRYILLPNKLMTGE